MTCPTILIMAAGMGSRYGGLKQLDEIGPSKETILEFSLFDAIAAGFKKAVFVIRKDFEEEFRSRFGTRWEHKINIEYVHQELNPYCPWLTHQAKREKPWGTGHAVLCAESIIQEPFAVINADDFYGRLAFQKMSDFLQSKCDDATYGMVSFQLGKTLSPNGPVSRGVCTLDSSDRLKSIHEISGIQDLNGRVENQTFPEWVLNLNSPVSMNFWGFHPKFFTSLKEGFIEFTAANQGNPRAEFYIPTLVFQLINEGKANVQCYSSPETWHGITYREDRQSVDSAMRRLVEMGIYPSPLWAN